MFTSLEQHGEEFAAELTYAVLNQEPSISRSALSDKVKRIAVALVHLSALGFVKRISQSIGAPELERTFDRLVQEENCETARLVKLAIALEHAPSTPRLEVERAYERDNDSPLGAWIMKSLVVEHISLNDIPVPERQRMCALVKVKYTGLLEGGSRGRTKRQ